MLLPVLNLPKFELRLKKEGDKDKIFDAIRRKWLVLTPEEWVRQNVTAFLIQCKSVPSTRLANEVSLPFNGLQRRCDSIIYNQEFKPLIIIEYKAPQIVLNQKVFDQIAVYNYRLGVPYLLVSNGMQHIFCSVDNENHTLKFYPEIPDYSQIIIP